jgi:hypothetical protein
MSYVNCPRCRLTVRLSVDSLAPAHCPRCEARHGLQEPVFLSSMPSRLFERTSVPVEPLPEAAPDRVPLTTV